MRLVFADDDFDVRVLVRMFVSSVAEIAGEAKDGQQAVDIFNEIRERGETVDVMVLDQMMPHLTGLEVARLVHELDPTVRLVLFSAAMDHDLASVARSAGVDAAIRKTELKDLGDLLEELVA